MIFEPFKHPDGTLSLSANQRQRLAKRGYSSTTIYTALLRLYNLAKKQSIQPVAESNLPPCGSCESIVFIPTGNCHACATCGESQGCS